MSDTDELGHDKAVFLRAAARRKAWTGQVALRSRAGFAGLIAAALAGLLAFGVIAGPSPAPASTASLASRGLNPLALDGRPGQRTISSLKTFPDLTPVIAKAPEATRAELDRAIQFWRDDRRPQALAIVGQLDVADPAVGLVAAWLHLSEGGSQGHVRALQSLAAGVRQDHAQSRFLAGIIALLQISFDHAGHLRQELRQVLLPKGVVAAATADDLASNAAAHWRQAAAQEPIAWRFIGLAHARGIGGAVDLPAAALAWREAARLGDDVSAAELASLLASGIGVPANVAEAIVLFRRDFMAGSDPSGVLLATHLTASAATGDEASADEAIAVLRTVLLDLGQTRGALVSQTHFLLGMLLTRVAPPSRRDIGLGMDHLRRGAILGDRSASLELARIHETGAHGAPDMAFAIGYHTNAGRRISDLPSRLASTWSGFNEQARYRVFQVFVMDKPRNPVLVHPSQRISERSRPLVITSGWYREKPLRTTVDLRDAAFNAQSAAVVAR